jgi:hypothetical protein
MCSTTFTRVAPASDTQRQQPSRPVVAPQLPAQDDFPSPIDPMHLQYVLRQINPDGCNIHDGRSHSS